MNKIALFCIVCMAMTYQVQAASLSNIEQLGKIMYKDKDFSFNQTQSCQTCHHQVAGFADPTNSRDPYFTVVSLGADGQSLGGRNAPTAAYAGFSPILSQGDDGEYVGGMFWDGRATGWTLLDPLAEQAQGPPLNPVEMNMPDKAAIVQAVLDSDYVHLFEVVFGPGSLDNVEDAYDYIAFAIAAYERSNDVQQFNSRFDRGILSEKEIRGMTVFGKKCAQCHTMNSSDEFPLFTNYSYHNIGIPVNPILAGNPVDLGLGGFLATFDDVESPEKQNGKFKVPTLRNVALSAPYGHNGYFATLQDMIRFKNSRDVSVSGWPLPEVNENINYKDLGNLEITDEEIDDLVAFLHTLSDN
ncbi:cytochrome-c peroxidase [Desulforhopalus sp. IMCC35007]|uniref:cytochrome-c peroxidase n=1 Tax=Desulforhopalus sp. IMCC35007 TaxID=2569543 RepID=UPI0010AE9DF1|nr:cytochrome c peroxidase [Desulforhopalus sp. IMCC35007]TKB06805.1 c-type cytochrome [Desulforhopalus sp. IMCC35007]